MVQVTNNTREEINFSTGSKDGEPIVKTVAPGATESVDLPADHPQIVGHAHAGAITVGGKPAQRAVEKAVASAAS